MTCWFEPPLRRGLPTLFRIMEVATLFCVAHDLVRKPVPTPDQVRGRLFRDHALRGFRLLGRHGLARDSGAAHVARLALIEPAHPMHGLAVVPHDKIVLAPAVDVDKLALRG